MTRRATHRKYELHALLKKPMLKSAIARKMGVSITRIQQLRRELKVDGVNIITVTAGRRVWWELGT